MPLDASSDGESSDPVPEFPVDSALNNPPAPSDQWVRAHYERIHRAAWMMTGDPWAAEDLAQETFVVAIDRWDRFDGRSTRSTWLYGILIRLRRRHDRTMARIRRRLKNYADRQTPATTIDPPTQLAQQQWRESVWADVAKLPAAQRDAITLRFANEMSYDEIAAVVGCAVGTTKTRVHHGLKRLREQGNRDAFVVPRETVANETPVPTPSRTH